MTVRTPATRHGRWVGADCEPGLASVIIPIYNRPAYLLSALDSVRAQTYRPIELLVVDDGSGPDTRDAVARWAASCPSGDGFELRRFRQENQGAPVARNRGAIESRGEYVLFLDSDDLIGPTKIAASVARLGGAAPLSVAHGPWRCLYCGGLAGYGPVRSPRALGDETGRLLAYVRGTAGVPPCTYVFRREALRAVGPWDEALRQRQDAEYLVRAVLTGCPFLPEERSIVYYRHHRLQHVAHPANFRRHFPSLLAVADRWHALLADGAIPAEAAPALMAGTVRLFRNASVARHSPSIAACRRRLLEWFGEDALRAVDGPAFRTRVWARRTLTLPVRHVLGELPLVRFQQLVGRCGAFARRPSRAEAPCERSDIE